MAEKKQKVRFRKGDKRPAKHKFTLSYETKPVKKEAIFSTCTPKSRETVGIS